MAANASIELPQGKQGSVVVETINDAKYVKKTYKNTNKSLRNREYTALVALKNCPHIVNVRENNSPNSPNSPNSKSIYTEYGEGGDLFDYIKDIIKKLPPVSVKQIDIDTMQSYEIDKRKISQNQQQDVMIPIDKIYTILFQLLSALHCMHKHHYYHLDLKPENIVFTDKEKQNIAIIDFGFSHHNDTENLDPKCNIARGTAIYRSPQKKLLMGKQRDFYLCQKDDIYALGTIMKDLQQLLISLTENKNNELYTQLGVFIDSITARNENDRWGWKEIKKWCIKMKKYFNDTKFSSNNVLMTQVNNIQHNGGSQKAKRKTRKQTPRR